MRYLLSLFAVFALVSCSTPTVVQIVEEKAPFTLHGNFCDHMVLQRDVPIRLSGTAKPGQTIIVSLSIFKKYCYARSNGEWEVTMSTPAPGGPYTLTIDGAADTPPQVIRDIMVGDVWLCAGTGQLMMPVWSDKPDWRLPDGEAIVLDNRNTSQIRFFDCTPARFGSPLGPQADPRGQWMVPDPRIISGSSALAYLFAQNLQQSLHVPIGIILCAWDGTRIQPWISEQGFMAGRHKEEQRTIQALRFKTPESLAREEALRNQLIAWRVTLNGLESEDDRLAAQEWASPELDDSAAPWQSLPAEQTVIPDGRVGFHWLRYRMDNLPTSWRHQQLTLQLGIIDGLEEVYVNGTLIDAADTSILPEWKYPRTYLIPGTLATTNQLVIALRIANLTPGGGLVSHPSERRLSRTSHPTTRIPLNGNWRYRQECTFKPDQIPIRPDKDLPLSSKNFPATIFNAMIAPWTRYPIRGVLWAHGDADLKQADEYVYYLRTLVNDWRNAWGNKSMPFLICQLGSNPEAGEEWEKIRTAQEKMLDFPQVYMLANDFPHSKLADTCSQIAQNLSGKAMSLSGAQVETIDRGPSPIIATRESTGLRIRFSNVGQGLVISRGDALFGFEIAGEDGQFHAAKAVIDGNSVLLTSPEVPQPLQARYGWQGQSEKLNLANQSGFLAEPFRIDTRKKSTR